MKKPELLAPCGDYNCFISAINAGADAVYLSGEKFGARAYAKNFSTDELISAIDYAHLFNVKVYLTVNTLIKNDEINDLYGYLLPLYEAGLDGVIVQDLGCVSYIREHFPDLPVHSSTQMAISGSEGVELMKELGIKRVVLARELSMSEITEIYNRTNLELECFVHGALCYSYSGKCLFSSLVGGRSGNRGRCAGPCRQPYNENEYLLSTKDICCLKLIPKLCNGSIASFKIEGRMKSPEYVAGVTGIFRKHIDRYYDLLEKYGENKAEQLFYEDKSLEKDYNTLTNLYTRGGNSEGYFFTYNGKKMISISDASYKKGSESVPCDIAEKYEITNKIPVYGFLSVSIENGAVLSVSTDDFSVSVSYGNVSPSENKPLTEETVKKQLNKTGGTAFFFSNLDLYIEDNVFMRVSDLNEIRRKAFSELTEKILEKYRRTQKYNFISNNTFENGFKKNDKEKYEVFAEINSNDQFEAALSCNSIEGIYVPFSFLLKNAEILSNNAGKKLYIKFPSVIRHDFLSKNKDFILDAINIADGVLIDNFEMLYYLKAVNFKGEIVGDIHLYAYNNYSKYALNRLGADALTIPVELNRKEMLSTDYSNQELIVYGRLPMMVSAQCINNTKHGCDKKLKQISIKDRIGAEFVSMNDCDNCTNTIYNSVPISFQGEKDFINKVNPKRVRLIFTDETGSELISIAGGLCESDFDGSFKLEKITKGHLQRGVL